MSEITPAAIALMTGTEKQLLRATAATALAEIHDEVELDELHRRVRRARTKYVTNYRRKAAKQVQKKKARGKAQPNSTKTLEKAEIFEEALARVSRRVADLSDTIAAELRVARLGAAAAAKKGQAPASRSAAKPETPAIAARTTTARRATRRPAKTSPSLTVSQARNVASTQARGARAQARRDAR